MADTFTKLAKDVGLERYYQVETLSEAIGYEPCYLNRHTTDVVGLNSLPLIHRYIQLCLKAYKTGTLVMFSVTAEEKNHKLFLEAAKQYKEVTIVQSASIHGRYKCWCILMRCTKRIAKI